MSAPIAFDTRAAFQEHWRALLARAAGTLDVFDPDGAIFQLGASDIDAALRHFLQAGGRLRVAVHDTTWLERDAPRFLRLLRDYGHAIECRVTPRALRQLSDSFAIADDLHVLRRFHSDHLRGVMAFDMAQETELSRLRFEAIWLESGPGLATTATGL